MSKLLKEDQKSIWDEDSPGRSSMATTPEMVDSVNGFISANRRITREDVSKQVGIYVGTAHKIVH